MKLPFLHLFQKKVPAEYFLALLFRDEQIQAVVFEQIAGRIQVVGDGKATLQTSVERASDDMLLDTADKAISIAEETLPDNIETHKTIFGVKESWVSDTHITKEYLDKLKIISKELDLQPIGFLVFPEAIAHLLQKEEGAPVSAILIESGKQQITITLLRAGRIVDTKEVALSESITETVENALRTFEDVEIFPSRIILFDTGDEALEKKFLTHKWSKSLPFLHVPQITVLPKDFDTRAVLFGTATQMGFDAIDVIKQPIRQHNGQFAEEFEQEPAPLTSKPLEEPENVEATESTEQPIHEEKQEEEPLEEVSGEDTSEYFGFVKNADVAQATSGVHATKLPHEAIEPLTEELPEEEKEEELVGNAYGFSTSGPIFFEGAKKILSQWKRFVPSHTSLDAVSETVAQFNFSSLLKGNKLILLVPALVVLLAGIIWYIIGLHAVVTLILSPKIVSQDQTVTFTTTGPTDPTNNIVAAQTVSVSEEGKISGTTTGTKTTGTPAKGQITINSTLTNSLTLTKGTTITSNNGLTYTLDNDVTIASSSGIAGNSSSVSNVPVTASTFGTNYNLPSGTIFTVNSYNLSEVSANNPSAFSGGTSTSITVVSQKDLDNLISQLTANLQAKAKTDLQAKATNGEVILPDFTKTTAGVTNFNHKVGDEASTVTLDGTITYETIAYQKSDIESYTKEALSGKLPTDLTLAPNGITYAVKNMATKNGTTTVTLTIQAALIPTVDTASLAKQIAGKNFIQAKDILSNVSQFSDATFTISPNLFFLPKILPRLSHNITIAIKTNE